MTTVLLASVSLFALVVTSRPILSSAVDLGDWAHASSTFQTSVQAAFLVRPGKDDFASDDTCFHSQTQKKRIECVSELGTQDVAAIESPPVKQLLLDNLAEAATEGQDAEESEGERVETRLVSSEPMVEQESLIDESPSVPLVVLAVSCVAAFLTLACVASTLYIIKSFRSQILASQTAWELLPSFWRHPTPEENATATAKQRASEGSCFLLPADRLLSAEGGPAQSHDSPTGDRPLYCEAVSDIESEWDDVDEKYQDALDMTPLPLIHDLPLEDGVPHPSHFSDPPLPTLSHILNQSTADRNTPLMRELPSADAHPAWSARATDSPPLGLSPLAAGVDATPQPPIQPCRRAYRSPVLEFDTVLAMQLRPGLGIGADSAWMVRFLMTIFGWFAVALTGNTR